MKYLTPDIEKMMQKKSGKLLAKPGISCGIFQDCHETETKYTKKIIAFNKKKNG